MSAERNALIREQKEGTQSNTESDIEFASEVDAKSFYEVVKKRLLDVNHWNDYAGTATAEFQLIDTLGNKVSGPAQKGNYFQIDIPGSWNGNRQWK